MSLGLGLGLGTVSCHCEIEKDTQWGPLGGSFSGGALDRAGQVLLAVGGWCIWLGTRAGTVQCQWWVEK